MQLYYPLVYRWCRGAGLQDQDAGDVCQEVFAGLAAGFHQYRPELRFRPWLRGITNNKLRVFWKRNGSQVEACGGTDGLASLAQIPQPELPSDLPEQADDNERCFLVQRALGFIRPEFRETTWRAFWETVVENRSPGDVAAELGVSRNAIYVAKSRVLHRLRVELEGLFE